MFPKFAEVIAAIENLKDRRIIEDYAVFGAMAQLFWDEAVPTFDLDVLVLFPATTGLISLEPLYQWAEEKGFELEAEHIRISGVPVQFVPAPDLLHEEAVRTAATLDYAGAPIRVVRPEYLIATWLKPPANNAMRRERAARLREAVTIDTDLLNDLMSRFQLSS